jgi:hypothetical protein
VVQEEKLKEKKKNQLKEKGIALCNPVQKIVTLQTYSSRYPEFETVGQELNFEILLR